MAAAEPQRSIDGRPADAGRYTFPMSVRMADDPSFSARVIKGLEAEVGQTPTSDRHRSLIDAHRRAGDLARASQAAESWRRFAPGNRRAAHLAAVLAQQSLDSDVYRQSDVQPAPFLLESDFLSVGARDRFLARALDSEQDFRTAGMGSGGDAVVDRDRRETEVLSLEDWEKEEIEGKVQQVAREACLRFGLPIRPIKKIEAKLTVHRDGGFFNVHQDAFTEIRGSSRHLSWVYYFHQNPKAYRGGDLVVFDSTCDRQDRRYSEFDYTRLVPKDNQLVLFPSWFFHGVTPVSVAPSEFGSSRFAVAGHIRC